MCPEEAVNITLQEEQTFVIYSPKMPREYPFVSCIWLISGPQPDGYITFTVPNFWSHKHREPNHDYFNVGKGHNVTEDTKVMDLVKPTPANSVTINGSRAWLRFESYTGFDYQGLDLQVEWKYYYGMFNTTSCS